MSLPVKLFCALDVPTRADASRLAREIAGPGVGLKLGLEYFVAEGPEGVRAVAKDAPLFLDLKLHDIPNTVAGAIRSACAVEPTLITVMASGGRAMMRAAADAARKAGGRKRPRIVAVTVLTSLDKADLIETGIEGSIADHALRLARLARESGLDGVVCSPHEVALLRGALGSDFLLIVPGVRPAGSAIGDQKRVMTPGDTLRAGADALVVGRPITQASDPATATRSILTEMAA
jgi:orotidine-5'-phosphate decarboxylase